ncbi:hypothetical protein BDK51DRAFT_13590, partial [Blyttiomyces helicus]
RVHTLQDGRKIVLASRVHEFLSIAQQSYDISVCSLGEQSYVQQVVTLLDSGRTLDPPQPWIRGLAYSARGEYLHIASSPQPNRPPKDLACLLPFSCVEHEGGVGLEALILDDNAGMWPAEQQGNTL